MWSSPLWTPAVGKVFPRNGLAPLQGRHSFSGEQAPKGLSATPTTACKLLRPKRCNACGTGSALALAGVRAAEASATTRTERPFASRGARPGIFLVPITRRLDARVGQRRAVFRSSRHGAVALEDFLAHQEPAPAPALMLQRWAVAFLTTHMEAFGSGVENIVPLLFCCFCTGTLFFQFCFFFNALLLTRLIGSLVAAAAVYALDAVDGKRSDVRCCDLQTQIH